MLQGLVKTALAASLYFLDFHFTVIHAVRGLPHWLGARFSAWLRYASREAGLDLDNICLAILPFQMGKSALYEGEKAALRIIAGEKGLPALPTLALALREGRAHGDISHLSLRLDFVRDAISGKYAWKAGMPGEKPAAFAENKLASELDYSGKWTLRIFTPLRLPAPRGLKEKGDIGRYCQTDFFHSGNALPYLASRLRFGEYCGISEPCLEQKPILADYCHLHWEDMRYSQERHIALGGVCGSLRFSDRPEPEIWKRLVIGQYLGAGKNARFGLGFWKIPELDNCRLIPLP